MEPIDPQIPDRFEIREELYRSEQNVRLRAFDTDLEQEVVLEFSGAGARQLAPSASERRTALRQARMRAKVKHDKIQPLKEIVETPQTIVHVLEPRAGETLERVLLEKGTLSPDETIDLGVALAEALQALHAEGVVHRAVAADNILMLGSEMSALTGFAFAKPIEGLGQSSLQYNPKQKETPAARALPHHPAPEQVAGQAADARSDIFAVGCVLYRCLTARPAFADHGAAWVEPQHPCQMAPDVPKDLAAVVLKCLRQSPMGRTPTMLELRAELLGAKRKSSDRHGKRGLPPIATAAAVLVLGAVIWAVFAMQDDTRRAANTGTGSGSGSGGTTSVADAPLATKYTKSWAVLIGTNYEGGAMPPLTKPESDIEQLKADLLALDFEVLMLKGPDATGAKIRETLHDLHTKLDRNDQVFLYFAGHGEAHPRSSSGYLLPHDAKPRKPRADSSLSWLRFSDVRSYIEDYDAKHVMLALDCCHSGKVFGKTRGVPPAVEQEIRGYEEIHLTVEAKVIMVSCTDSQTAADNSVFALGFQESLQEVRRSGHPVTHTQIAARIKRLGARRLYPQRPSAKNLFNTDAEFVFFQKR